MAATSTHSAPQLWIRHHAVVLILLTVYAVVLFRTAWISDDAYITLRTVDNLLHGHGLRWNIAERVQSYTHPLWMFLLAGAVFATGEAYYTTIGLSILVSLAAMGFVVFAVAHSRTAAVFTLGFCAVSKAFVDYSTSGLENPLSNALFAVFLYLYSRREPSIRTLMVLSLVVALAALNRLDTVLLYAPALVYRAWQLRSVQAIAAIATGFAPLIAWELFSFVYYGFLFPNTAYAKLNTGIARGELFSQGLHYAGTLIRTDPTTAALILIASVVPFATRRRAHIAIAMGLLAYLAYVCRIGGDFMSGRFYATPYFAAVAMLSQYPLRWPRARTWCALALVLATGASALVWPPSPLLSGSTFGANRKDIFIAHGVADERRYYYPSTGLFRAGATSEPVHGWVRQGRTFRNHPGTVKVTTSVGFAGYYAGPEVHIVDVYGLVDPLLARLPARFNPSWRVGHYVREVPKGYVDSLQHNANRLPDADLADYYDQLQLVIRGPIWSWERIATAIQLNLGSFDNLIDRPRYRLPRLTRNQLRQTNSTAWTWQPSRPLRLTQEGIRLTADRPVHISTVDVWVAQGVLAEIALLDGDQIIARAPAGSASHGNAYKHYSVPVAAAAATAVWIIPKASPQPQPQPRVDFSIAQVLLQGR